MRSQEEHGAGQLGLVLPQQVSLERREGGQLAQLLGYTCMLGTSAPDNLESLLGGSSALLKACTPVRPSQSSCPPSLPTSEDMSRAARSQ